MKIILALSILLNAVLITGGWMALKSLGGPRYVLYKMQNRGTTGVYGHRKMLLDMLPKTEGEIIFLGDSITEGGEWAELLDDPRVKNRGISGDGTAGVLARLEGILKGQPKQLFLMIGVNDLLFHDPAYTLANYKKIVEQIEKEAPETELILQNILPINNDVRNIRIENSAITKVNEGITQIADNHDLKLLNIAALVTDNEGNLAEKYTDDGIHINGTAYFVWRDELKKHLNRSTGL